MASGSAKIYTRTGDKGKTSLIGGTRVSKASHRLEAYGTLDELNSYVGWIRREMSVELGGHTAELKTLDQTLHAIQAELFNLGSQLACEDAKLRATLPQINDENIKALENEMDRYSKDLVPLKHFVLPGGSRTSSLAHVARTVCRRAERAMVSLDETAETVSDTDADTGNLNRINLIYINRLSDYFFVLARHANRLLAVEEPLWIP